jgi:hypothetical protein
MFRITHTDYSYLVELRSSMPWDGIWWSPVRRFRNLRSAEEFVEKRMGEEGDWANSAGLPPPK